LTEPAVDDPPIVARKTTKRRIRMVLVLLVAVAFVIPLGAALNGRVYGRVAHDDNDGPLKGGAATKVSAPTDIGQPMTYALFSVMNTSGKPATLDDIRLVPEPTGEFEVIDILLAGPERQLAGTSEDGFPPNDLLPYLKPVDGAVIAAGDTGEALVVVGLRLNRLGQASFQEIHIDYRLGGRRYTGRYQSAYVLCTPREVKDCGSGEGR
jgi:hypothetical protein